MINLSSEQFPEQDDVERLYYLYSETSHDIEDIFMFWSRSIRNYCFASKSCRVTHTDLENCFTVRDIIPSTLKRSMQQMVKEGMLAHNIVDLSTKPSFIASLFTFAVSVILPRTDSFEDTFIFLPLLEVLSKEVRAYASTIPEMDRLFFFKMEPTYSDIKLTLNGLLQAVANYSTNKELEDMLQNLDENDKSLLWDYMVIKKYAVVSSDGLVFKIVVGSALGAITASDVPRLQLRNHIQAMDAKTKDLEASEIAITRRATEYHTKKNKEMAIRELKNRKLVRRAIDNCRISRNQIEEALQRIDSAEHSRMIIDAYAIATAALRVSREESGITPERIDDVMNDFEEEVAEHNDIGAAMAGADGPAIEEDEELVAELDAMMSEMDLGGSAHNRPVSALSLPMAPSSTPVDGIASTHTASTNSAVSQILDSRRPALALA